MLTKTDLLKIFLIFIAWRGVLFLLAFIATDALYYQPSFPYSSLLPLYNLPTWVYSWVNFDGIHYLTIVNQGYESAYLIQAFFPALPTIIKQATFTRNVITNGLIVTNFFAFTSFVLLFRLGREYLTKKETWRMLFIFICFPTSFFLGAYYTESLFLSLVLASFLAAHYKQWWLAGLLAIGVTATRVVGIIIIPALMIEYFLPNLVGSELWQKINKKSSRQKILADIKQKIYSLKTILNLFFIAIGSLGLISYMWFLQNTYGDPLYFFSVQSEFGGGRQETLITYPQVVYRYLKIIWSYQPHNLQYLSYIQEFIAGTLGLIGALLTIRYTKPSYAFFTLGVFLIPTLTGTFSSMPRYLLVAWPIFFVAAKIIKNRPAKLYYFSVSTLLLIHNIILFIQGYWVA